MNSLRNAMEMADSSYFMVYRRGDGFQTAGQAHVELGHTIAVSSHQVADGIFAQWYWDGSKLIVTNDRYGIYPLFWCELPHGGIAISSSLIKLIELGAPTELDAAALAVFFRLGTFVGNDTAFSSIKVVPPNALFVWQDGHLRCRGRYPDIPQAAGISRDDAIDQYISLFSQAMARRPPPSDGFAMPISGGRDSRHILLELHRTGLTPVVCASALDNPPSPNEDSRIGGILCDALGYQHVDVHQKLSIFAAEYRKNTETHLGASAHGWYLALADYLAKHTNCVYDGLAGDVLSQSSNLTPERAAVFQSGRVDQIANCLLFGDRAETTALNHIVDKKLQMAMSADVARQRISREIEKHLDMPNPTSSFFFWNRTRRMTALAPYCLLNGISTVYTPFLDHDLFNFLTALPTTMVMDHRLHDDAIARAYPSFSHIPYADDKTATKSGTWRTRMRFLSEATRLFVFQWPSALLDNAGLRAKILAGLLSCGHIRPWISLSIVYLSQLESLIDNDHNNN